MNSPSLPHCKADHCPRLANSFSDYCGEHLSDESAYLDLLAVQIQAADEHESLLVHFAEIEDKVICNKQFSSLYLQEVVFKNCTFIRLNLHMPQLLKVKFESCSFVNCTLGDMELSEFTFIRCRFHRVVFDRSNLQHGDFKECRFYQLTVNETSLENTDIIYTVSGKAVSIIESSIIRVSLQHGAITNLVLKDNYASGLLLANIQLVDCELDNVSNDFEQDPPRLCDLKGIKVTDCEVDMDVWAQWNNLDESRSYPQFLIDALQQIVDEQLYEFHEDISDIALPLCNLYQQLSAPLVAQVKEYFSEGYRYYLESECYGELGQFVSTFGFLKDELEDVFSDSHVGLEGPQATFLPAKMQLSQTQGLIKVHVSSSDYSAIRFSRLLNHIDAIYRRICQLGGESEQDLTLVTVEQGSWIFTAIGQLAHLLVFKETVDSSTIKLNQQQTRESQQKETFYQLATIEKKLALMEEYGWSEQKIEQLLKDNLIKNNLNGVRGQTESISSAVYDRKGRLIAGDGSANRVSKKV